MEEYPCTVLRDLPLHGIKSPTCLEVLQRARRPEPARCSNFQNPGERQDLAGTADAHQLNYRLRQGLSLRIYIPLLNKSAINPLDTVSNSLLVVVPSDVVKCGHGSLLVVV